MNSIEATRAQIEAHIRRNLRPDSRPAALHLRCLQFGHDHESIADVEPQALVPEEIEVLAGELAGAAVERATEARRTMRFAIDVDGVSWPTLRLLVHPEAEVPPVPQQRGLTSRRSSEEMTTVAEDDGPPAYIADHQGDLFPRVPPLTHQAAALTAYALKSLSECQDLVVRSAQQREEGLMRENERLRGENHRLADREMSVSLAREQLLDRQAERQLEIDRVKQRDKWVQDGFAKIVSLVALHAPMILDKFGMAVDPKAKDVLFDIVGSVAAAKPFVSAMRLASDVAQKNGSHSNGAPPPPSPTTAGALAASIISGGGESVGAAALAAFSSVTVEFINSVRDKLAMVKPLLDERAGTLLDKIIELTDAHGTTFQAIGRAALQGATQVTRGAAAGPDSEEDQKIMRMVEITATFWAAVRPEDVEKMRTFLPATAREALEEIRRYDFSPLTSSPN